MDQRANAENEIDMTLFVACYNEEPNIVPTLKTIEAAIQHYSLTWEVVIIDDASTDGTIAQIEDYVRANPHLPIRLFTCESNRGLGMNFVEGAYLGRGTYYRLVCGDNVEDVDMLRHVFGHVGKCELVLFYHADNQRSFLRKIISRCFTHLVNFISGHRLRYYNGCPIFRRRDVMRWHTNYHGFGFQADTICRLLDTNCPYIEVPVKAIERTADRSKALTLKNLLSVAHTLLDLLIRRIARILYPRRRVYGRCKERLDLRQPLASSTVANGTPPNHAKASLPSEVSGK